MRFFDLHCDTIYRVLTEGGDLYNNNFHVSLSKLNDIKHYIGCFAICVDEEYGADAGFELFNKASDKIESELEKYNDRVIMCKSKESLLETANSRKNGIIFTVEGGMEISDDIDRVEYLYSKGVRVLTLTWNGRNHIGDGAEVEIPRGLTTFGVDVVKKMELLGMVVDVSHASDSLFYDVSQTATKPFIATHSNSRTICKHKRNLTDEQFDTIRACGGIVGINLYKNFLNEKGNANLSEVLKHIEYFLSRSGEDVLCIGSDFDGADMPTGIHGVESIPDIYEYCLRHNYIETLVDKIFYRNAYDFFTKML